MTTDDFELCMHTLSLSLSLSLSLTHTHTHTHTHTQINTDEDEDDFAPDQTQQAPPTGKPDAKDAQSKGNLN